MQRSAAEVKGRPSAPSPHQGSERGAAPRGAPGAEESLDIGSLRLPGREMNRNATAERHLLLGERDGRVYAEF